MATQQKKTIKIPKGHSPVERRAIAQDIIDFIVDRTQSGKNIQGTKWKGKAGRYSKGYINSPEFKAAGKNKNKIDLTLSEDMLAMLGHLKDRSGSITIGYEKGDPINGKVEGNRIGSYGNSPNPSKARDFLGISDKDLNKILKRFPLEDKEKRQQQVELIKLALESSSGVTEGVFADVV